MTNQVNFIPNEPRLLMQLKTVNNSESENYTVVNSRTRNISFMGPLWMTHNNCSNVLAVNAIANIL